MNILLAEDEKQLSRALVTAMQATGYHVDPAYNGQEAVDLAGQRAYDVIILDIMMPKLNGIEALKQLRQTGNKTYVIMLTAMAEIDDKVTGLDAGADDYLSKPFHPEELQLRIQALLRRARGLANQPTLEAAGLHLDESRQCVSRDGVDIQLTAAEFRLLRYFMLHPQQILSKSHLAEHLYDGETERDSNVLEVHVNHLRRKLGRSVIETRRGQGYIYAGSAA